MSTTLSAGGYVVTEDPKLLDYRISFLTTSAYNALTIGQIGVIYTDAETSGQPQKRWDPVSAAFVTLAGGGGATTMAALTDRTTYDLPTNNGPLAAALALKAVALQPEQTIAAGATTDIGSATSNNISATGTAQTITALGTATAGTVRRVRWSGINTITYNATSLITPTAANVTTAAGDFSEFISLGSGNWRLQSEDQAVVVGSGTYAGLSDAATATLPTTNTPLANALANKADAIIFNAALAAGPINFTHTTHAGNHVNKVTNTITNGVMAGTATSGFVDGDVIEVDVNGTGFFWVSGKAKAIPGCRLYAGPGETWSGVYNAADDTVYSTTAIAADFGGGDSYIQSMPGGGSTGQTNISTFSSSGVTAGTAGATTVGLFAGVCAPIREKITAAASAASARIQAAGGAVSTGAPFIAYMPATAASKPTYGRFGMGVVDAVGAGSVNTLGFLSVNNFNQDGSAQRNCAACTNDAADSNYSMVFANGSASTKIALGASFPVNTSNSNFPNVFLALFPSIAGAALGYYCVTDLVTGAVANGVCTTTLPVAGQQLLPQVQRTGPSGSSNITIIEYMPITGGGWAQLGAS